MNIWTAKSTALTSKSDYLDALYKIYPMAVNLKRQLPEDVVKQIRQYFNDHEDIKLLKLLLRQEIFPIKDSYVAYLRKNKEAIEDNPQTAKRLSAILRELGIEEILIRATAPKETNRQIGPLFRRWLRSGGAGVNSTDNINAFLDSQENSVLDATDAVMQKFAVDHLGYNHDKGLDFIGKINGKYVIAEAKFLSDYGGHQNAQFNDAISTMRSELLPTDKKVIKIAILDGVLYLKGESKMYKAITNNFKDDEVIISAVLLRDYLKTL